MDHFGFPVEAIVIFAGVIALSLFMDLFAHRKAHAISILDASLWSGFWVMLALGFYGYLWARFGAQWADLYLAGLALEKSLSVDNLMVFMAIFASFGIKGALQHRILYWGIIGALVFRAVFVAIGAGLFAAAPWVGFVFAAIVAWSGWKMLTRKEEAEQVDYADHWSVRMARRLMPVWPRLVEERFFVRGAQVGERAALLATPAFLCLIAIEASDLMFAFDSVPAVIAVTQEPLLVYAAMIFAMLGLRSLYFVLSALAAYLVHLEKAVIGLLFFIAVKLVLQAGNHAFGWDFLHISPHASMMVVLGALAAGVVASLIWPGKPKSP